MTLTPGSRPAAAGVRVVRALALLLGVAALVHVASCTSTALNPTASAIVQQAPSAASGVHDVAEVPHAAVAAATVPPAVAGSSGDRETPAGLAACLLLLIVSVVVLVMRDGPAVFAGATQQSSRRRTPPDVVRRTRPVLVLRT